MNEQNNIIVYDSYLLGTFGIIVYNKINAQRI